MKNCNILVKRFKGFKEYCFICGRCPVYASLRSALNECPLDIQRPANFFEKKFDKKLLCETTFRYLKVF